MPTTQHKLFQDRSICQNIYVPMTQQSCGKMKDQIISLSPDMGAGYFRYISPCKNVEAYVSDVTFRKRTVLKEQTGRESFSISFCISDILEWEKPGIQEFASLEGGDCRAYENGRYEVENYYEAGLQYIGIDLNLYPDRFGMVTNRLLEKKATVSPEMPTHKLPKYKMIKTVEALLHQILCCNYIDRLRFLHLEGKILELVTAFANEVILEQDLFTVQKQMPISDLAVLTRVRKIINGTYAEPMTTVELAKMSFISESELQKCFQQQYGMTTYQYVLECGMEEARELLADGNDQIKEVANLVGYSNIDHLSEAFQKKSGRTPNMYMKSFRH